MGGETSHLEQVADSLIRIEIELRRLDQWQGKEPSTSALASTQPFCVDTLSFPQWLQFVFIRRMKVLIEAGQPLPAVSGMAPMAEEHFRGRRESGNRLIRELEWMDQLLSAEG